MHAEGNNSQISTQGGSSIKQKKISAQSIFRNREAVMSENYTFLCLYKLMTKTAMIEESLDPEVDELWPESPSLTKSEDLVKWMTCMHKCNNVNQDSAFFQTLPYSTT